MFIVKRLLSLVFFANALFFLAVGGLAVFQGLWFTSIVSLGVLSLSFWIGYKLWRKNVNDKQDVPLESVSVVPESTSSIEHIPDFDDDFGDAAAPKTIHFLYQASSGETSKRTVTVFKHKAGEYIKGRCHARNATRTFKLDRIIGDIIDTGTGELLTVDKYHARLTGSVLSTQPIETELFVPDENYPSKPSPVSMEVLFTGIPKVNRDRLEALAWKAGHIVRTDVTKNLDIMVQGRKNAAVKIAKAKAQGVHIMDIEEFEVLISVET